MQRTVWTAALSAGAFASAFAQQLTPPKAPVPSGPAVEVTRSFNAGKLNIIKSAEEMPEANYALVPMPEVRTFARVVNHITEAQIGSCSAVNGVAAADRPKVPADTADKATIVAALKASFVECDKALASTTDANFTEMIQNGPNKRSRAGLLWGTVSHNNEQYSALALYMRMKGLTPPSSEK